MGNRITFIPPKLKTDAEVAERAAMNTLEARATACAFGLEYFDGARRFGYGGYRYDGRWWNVAQQLRKHYLLRDDFRVLDVGCAKGFLVYDLMLQGIDAFGLDISQYAITHCAPPVTGRLHLGDARLLPFQDESFDLVVSFNTLHNLDRPGIVQALHEIQRVSAGRAFVQVDGYDTPEERERLEKWILTARWWGSAQEWQEVFAEAGFEGDWDLTKV